MKLDYKRTITLQLSATAVAEALSEFVTQTLRKDGVTVEDLTMTTHDNGDITFTGVEGKPQATLPEEPKKVKKAKPISKAEANAKRVEVVKAMNTPKRAPTPKAPAPKDLVKPPAKVPTKGEQVGVNPFTAVKPSGATKPNPFV